MSGHLSKQNTDTNISVLIPDGESHLLVYIVNCLSSVSGIKIYVLSTLQWNPLRFSRHVAGFIYHPKTDNDNEWLKAIKETVEKKQIDIVLPIFETGIYKIIKNKAFFSPKINLVPLPDIENFATAINKWQLVKHCEKHKISVPKSCLIKPEDQNIETQLSNLSFPIILKPLEGYGGGMGVKRFNTLQEAMVYLEMIAYPVLVQEFIVGYDIDCSVLVKNGEISAYTIQKGSLKGTGPFVPHVGIKFIANDKLYRLVENLMRSLKWNGVAHLDMRYDEQLDQFVIIEVNPRYWATIDGSKLVGVNFPYLSILQARAQQFEIPVYEQKEYLNLKGVVKSIKKNPLFLLRWKFMFTNTQLRFVFLDPAPTMVKFIHRTKNIIVKRTKRIYSRVW